MKCVCVCDTQEGDYQFRMVATETSALVSPKTCCNDLLLLAELTDLLDVVTVKMTINERTVPFLVLKLIALCVAGGIGQVNGETEVKCQSGIEFSIISNINSISGILRLAPAKKKACN